MARVLTFDYSGGMRWLLVLLLTLVPAGAVARAPYCPHGKMVRGVPEVGWVYAGGGLCTASAVGPRHILTAAHCIHTRDSGVYKNSDGETRGIVAWKVPRAGQDLAIGELDRAIEGPYLSPGSLRSGRWVTAFSRGACEDNWKGLYARSFVWKNRAVVPWKRLCVCPGGSGSPVVTSDSRIVAIIVGYKTGPNGQPKAMLSLVDPIADHF